MSRILQELSKSIITIVTYRRGKFWSDFHKIFVELLGYILVVGLKVVILSKIALGMHYIGSLNINFMVNANALTDTCDLYNLKQEPKMLKFFLQITLLLWLI